MTLMGSSKNTHAHALKTTDKTSESNTLSRQPSFSILKKSIEYKKAVTEHIKALITELIKPVVFKTGNFTLSQR